MVPRMASPARSELCALSEERKPHRHRERLSKRRQSHRQPFARLQPCLVGACERPERQDSSWSSGQPTLSCVCNVAGPARLELFDFCSRRIEHLRIFMKTEESKRRGRGAMTHMATKRSAGLGKRPIDFCTNRRVPLIMSLLHRAIARSAPRPLVLHSARPASTKPFNQPNADQVRSTLHRGGLYSRHYRSWKARGRRRTREEAGASMPSTPLKVNRRPMPPSCERSLLRPKAVASSPVNKANRCAPLAKEGVMLTVSDLGGGSRGWQESIGRRSKASGGA